jgi:nucleoid-associated protein YgaU
MSPGSVTYRIKKGDTLWDISATYYRNPWLYPRLAKANSIPNPDLIFAGTRITIPPN